MTRRGQGGFTIVETMIVLAVTAALFLVAVLAVGGKQNETEFQQAINDTQSNIRKIINEVNSGDYGTATNLNCNVSGGNLNITQGGAQNNEGSNTGCEFLGKVVQLGLSTNKNEFITYPVAGLQCLNNAINGAPCDGTIDQTKPLLVAPAAAGAPSPPDTSSPTNLEYGLSVVYANYVSGATRSPIGAVGFISGVGSYTGGQLASGTQTVALVPILNTTTSPADTFTAVTAINANLANSYDTVTNVGATNYTVQLCLASGTTQQSGLITIGVNGSGSLDAVSTTIFSDKTCT